MVKKILKTHSARVRLWRQRKDLKHAHCHVMCQTTMSSKQWKAKSWIFGEIYIWYKKRVHNVLLYYLRVAAWTNSRVVAWLTAAVKIKLGFCVWIYHVRHGVNRFKRITEKFLKIEKCLIVRWQWDSTCFKSFRLAHMRSTNMDTAAMFVYHTHTCHCTSYKRPSGKRFFSSIRFKQSDGPKAVWKHRCRSMALNWDVALIWDSCFP